MNKVIKIDIGRCFMCGEVNFTKNTGKSPGPKSKTKNHAIPVMLKPKYNILMPLHQECHQKLNNIYIHQQKGVKKEITSKRLNYLKSRVESLAAMSNKFDERVMTILKQIQDDLEELK